MMIRRTTKHEIDEVALLQEPLRWALYLYISGRKREVGRDEAARALRITRALAAFHLDKLAEQGLVEVTYRRLSKRSGPGAGRPAKLYRRADRDLSVHWPPRRYELAARLLLEAAEKSAEPGERGALEESADRLGRELGERARHRAGAGASNAKLIRCAIEELRDFGFEPVRAPNGEIVLTNCPFHALVEEHREMICGMNLALMQGVVRGLGEVGFLARLDPRPGLCCVLLCPRK